MADIVGRVGRNVLKNFLPSLKEQFCPDVTIANGENAAGGLGIDLKTADEIYKSGVDIITTGNHVWNKKNLELYLNGHQKIIRPANYQSGAPGKGFIIYELNNGQSLGIINLIGRVFMSELLNCPFYSADEIISNNLAACNAIFLDFHAEATSEKKAMGLFLDGKITCLAGTHTHVQTADESILPEGTAFITDVGMCGSSSGVIGADPNFVITKFLTGRPQKFELSQGSPMINAILVETEENSIKAKSILRINQRF